MKNLIITLAVTLSGCASIRLASVIIPTKIIVRRH